MGGHLQTPRLARVRAPNEQDRWGSACGHRAQPRGQCRRGLPIHRQRGNKLIIERPKSVGNCAYTQSIPVGDDKLCVYCSTSVNVVEMPDVVGILLERDNLQVSPFQNLTVCKKLHSYPHRKKLRLILIASPTIRHLLRKALFFPTSIRLVIKQQ